MSAETLTDALSAADGEVSRHASEIAEGRWRLGYHLMPPTGWMNDPNGFVEFEGRYHLFYQFWPYAPEWGPMHWGHAVSEDLVHWSHEPTALAPSEEYDCNPDVQGYGCFSGSALVDTAGRLALLYTGHVDGRTPMQTQNLAVSEDGVTFVKSVHNPVIAGPPVDGSPDFRDPKLFVADGQTFAVIGSTADGIGEALLYRAERSDLTQWSYVGVLAQSNGQEGTMWECPDLMTFDACSALVISPMQGALNTTPFVQVGEFDAGSGEFHAESTRVLDGGCDFYAPQSMVDSKGRRLLIGWMQQWFQKNVTGAEGWSGAMTIPREILIEGGRVIQRPVPELMQLRGEPQTIAPQRIGRDGISFDTGESAEVRIVVDAALTGAIRLAVRASADRSEETVYVIDPSAGSVSCDRSRSGEGDITGSYAEFRPCVGELEIRVFVDVCSIELFVNGGEAVLTNRVYPMPTSTRMFVEPVGGGEVAVQDCTVWPLRTGLPHG